jgi:hypothetical protein
MVQIARWTLVSTSLWLLVSGLSTAAHSTEQSAERNQLAPPREVAEILATEAYDMKVVKVDETRFVIYGRKSGGIGVERIARNLTKIWRSFTELPRERVPVAWIVDVEAPMGGGPLAPFAVGLFSSKTIGPEFQAVLETTIGWARLPSTQAYIDTYYAGFTDPTQAYVEDMLTHEIGHLFFGFGLTTEPNRPLYRSWFSLGLGLVYDRVAWGKNNASPSPLFDGLRALYQDKYSKISEIDQRLIDPDTANDGQFDMNRAQVFAHGKSHLFLSALRDAVGAAVFDNAVTQYLSRAPGSSGGYDEFLKVLPAETESIRLKVEKEFQVR